MEEMNLCKICANPTDLVEIAKKYYVCRGCVEVILEKINTNEGYLWHE